MIYRFDPKFHLFFALALVCVLTAAFAGPLAAQKREVPYWATINTDELNMRVGPSIQYKILWVYRREGLPVKVLRRMEGWWYIRDQDGDEGWVTSNMMSNRRGASVIGEGLAPMRSEPSSAAALRWNAEPGVVGKLLECQDGWCEIDVAGRIGWVLAKRLWGVGPADNLGAEY